MGGPVPLENTAKLWDEVRFFVKTVSVSRLEVRKDFYLDLHIWQPSAKR